MSSHAPLSAMLETLEARTFLAAAPTTGVFPDTSTALNRIYVESNNPNAGQNSILSYRRTSNGALKFVAEYKTGATGFLNADDRLGPQDNDRPIIVSKDRALLFAVNGASNSITSFHVDADGALTQVVGGRIKSGGAFPVSLELVGRTLYVLNKGTVGPFETGSAAPNISIFRVLKSGRLTLVSAGAVTFSSAKGSTPSQVLVSPDGGLLFADRLFINPPVGEEKQLDAFKIDPVDGTLTRTAGSPAGASGLPPGAFPSLEGLVVHPTQRIIYAGLAQANGVAVFTYDAEGVLTYVASQPISATEPCWTTIDKSGKYLYVANSQSDSVVTLSLEDPLRPVQIQALVMRPPQLETSEGIARFSSLPHQFSFDPAGGRLYVLNQQRSKNDTFPQGSNLHVLNLGDDGLLYERTDPLIFLERHVPKNSHPQGVVVV